MAVKYKPANPDCFQLCQFCFWYDEEKNQCDLYAPIEEVGDEHNRATMENPFRDNRNEPGKLNDILVCLAQTF